MKLNRLLERQLARFLPSECRNNEAFQAFIQAVNDSYNAYERDKELAERAFQISEDEYREINNQLKEEVKLKKDSINQLSEAIKALGDSALPERNDENDLLHIVSYLKKQIDIRQQAEQKLQDQKLFYEQVLNEIPANIAIMTEDHRYLFVNPGSVADPEIRKWIIGKSDEEYHIYRNKPVTYSHERVRHFNEAIRTGVKKIWEEPVINRKGETEYHLRILHPVFNDKNEFEIMIIYGFDITDRKKIEEKIKLSEARYRGIFDHSLALICVHDLDGIIQDVNRAAINTLGYSYEELVGRSLTALLPEDKRQEFKTQYLEEINTAGKAEGIMVALNREGKKVYLLYQNYLLTNETGQPYVIGFSQDITDRINAERALKKSEEKYRNIIENMNLGLVEVDRDENIVYANQSFCDMSGYSVAELTGQYAPSLLGVNTGYDHDTNNRRYEGRSDAYELNVKNKNGAAKWWLISGAPVFDNNGTFTGSIGIHLDITIQKQLEQELRRAKAEAEQSAHAKEIFLANMSHEIRTPMNAILGISKILSKTEMDEQQTFYLNTIRTAANNLLVIINDLLDFSKIEAGKISLERIGFRLDDIIGNAIQVLRHKAEEKDLIITSKTGKDIAPILMGDPYRINQVLMNLLSNSIKFTEHGTVDVSCTLVDETATSQKIQFRVTDTGIGMSESFLKNLFDKFTQEDESISRKFGGTGLGMSISKQLVELMGGDIQVASQKNIGTAISFTVTFTKGASADLPQQRVLKADNSILKNKKLLLAEDNEINRLVASTVLKQYGAEVITAENGKVAIEKFKAEHFDLVLMDVHMPEKDGLETTRYIRQHLDSSIPIIALTASAFKHEEERCLQAGMNDFITKPFDEEKMIKLIAQWLGRNIETAAPHIAEQPQQQLYDLENIRNISKGDEAFVQSIITLFIDTMPASLKQMDDALEHENYATLATLAHHIKAPVQSMGIISITEDINLLESARNGNQPDQSKARKALDNIVKVTNEVIRRLREE
ncbi:PAS domain S-box protein [Chitinophagaceae bacterium MMS25-I14]